MIINNAYLLKSKAIKNCEDKKTVNNDVISFKIKSIATLNIKQQRLIIAINY